MTITLEDFTVSSEFDVKEVEECLRKWGVAVLPGWLSDSRLAGLRKEFDELLHDENEEYIYRFAYETGQGTSINHDNTPKGQYPFVFDVFQDKKMRTLMNKYVGVTGLLNYEIYATYDFKSGGLIAPTHFDKLWTLKFMIYLEDVEVGCGPFGVIPGSAAIARERFRSLFDENKLTYLSTSSDIYQKMGNDNISSDAGEVIDIIAKAGSLIVFDTDTFHRAGWLDEGKERKVLRGHTGPSVIYSKIRKKSQQWWRGERPCSKKDAVLDKILSIFG